MKTLIVDDNNLNRTLLARILSIYSEYDTACNGKEAVDFFNRALDDSEPYDLIFLDINMPVLDGLSALKIIRGIEKSWNIPDPKKAKILMATALTDKKFMYMSHSLQAQGYILKPFQRDKILKTLSDLGFSLEEKKIEVLEPDTENEKVLTPSVSEP